MVDWMRIVNHPAFNIVFFMALRQYTKKLPLDEPDTLWTLRALYIVCQLLVIGLYYWLMWVVVKKNDQTPLRYVEPKKQNWDGTESPEQLITTTYQEYDVQEIKKGVRQALTGVLMVAFMHLQFKFVQPLLIQSILGFKTFLTTKEARIHIWGEPTTNGPLRRPFRVEAPFGIVPESQQPKTDKASIKRAEKALKAE